MITQTKVEMENLNGPFLARDSIMLSALNAIARPLSVRPSVCLSVTRVYQAKTVEVRITQFSVQVVPSL